MDSPLTVSGSCARDCNAHVKPGFAPGVVGPVARGPDIETFVLGKKAFGDGADMRRDSLFLIASMTKPITATAVMMLVEEGKFRLDEPVDRLLPDWPTAACCGDWTRTCTIRCWRITRSQSRIC